MQHTRTITIYSTPKVAVYPSGRCGIRRADGQLICGRTADRYVRLPAWRRCRCERNNRRHSAREPPCPRRRHDPPFEGPLERKKKKKRRKKNRRRRRRTARSLSRHKAFRRSHATTLLYFIRFHRHARRTAPSERVSGTDSISMLIPKTAALTS